MERTCIWRLKRKREIHSKVTCIALCLIFLFIGIFGFSHGIETAFCKSYEEVYLGEEMTIEATAYCLPGTTASGCQTREGICAGKKEWLGLTAVVWTLDENGDYDEFLGFYDVLDTGSHKKIKNGECIDIYMPTYDECIKFGRKKVSVTLYDARG